MGIAGWLLGLVGIGVVATSVSLLLRDLFQAVEGRPPKSYKKALLSYAGGMLLGVALFAIGVAIGFFA